jgi:chitinase
VVSYHDLAADYVDENGWERHWDDDAKAPYLERDGDVLSYDDPESIRHKVRYLRETGLRGVMYWEYGHDRSGELLAAMADGLAETADQP